MATCERPTLLIVDDSDDLKTIMKRLLNNRGFDIEIAAGGDDAFEWLKLNSAWLVISDVDMPNGTGIKLWLFAYLSG